MALKTISQNRKAHHDYHIKDSVEAGLVLTGTEIKSIRAGKVSLRDTYAKPEGGDLWLMNAHIAPYEQGNRYNHEPDRRRKLLLHREQIVHFSNEVLKKGNSLVPLRLYLKNGIAKVELGLARGKKTHDKRQSLIQRETERDMAHAVKLRRI
ncbi:SsrA-binding protein SmpB [Chloroflexota bacterium]